jgi:hypothetical protein
MQQEIAAVINFDPIVFITALEGDLEIMILLNMHTMNSVSSGNTDTFIQKY